MKQFIWTLIQKYFRSEIQSHVESFKSQHHRDVTKSENDRRIRLNYPIGKKVMSRSNEPDPLFIGEVVGYQVMEKSGSIFVLVQDAAGNVIMSQQEPAYWSEEREAALKKLSWDEQFNVMSKYDYYIDTETKLRKESFEYQNRKS